MAFWSDELGRIRVCRIVLRGGEVAELPAILLGLLLDRPLTWKFKSVSRIGFRRARAQRNDAEHDMSAKQIPPRRWPLMLRYSHVSEFQSMFSLAFRTRTPR
jgi:hypothetical protein